MICHIIINYGFNPRTLYIFGFWKGRKPFYLLPVRASETLKKDRNQYIMDSKFEEAFLTAISICLCNGLSDTNEAFFKSSFFKKHRVS